MSRLRRLGLLSLAVALAGTACDAPFANDNPYHPGADFALAISATRDTLNAADDSVRVEFVVTPAAPRYDVQWLSRDGTLEHRGDGRFILRLAGLQTRRAWVIAGFGTRRDSVSVVIRQVPAALDLSCICGVSTPCGTLTATTTSCSITTTLDDVGGTFIPITAPFPPSTLVARTPGIVSLSGGGALLPTATVTAVASGSTWLVGSVAGLTDSLLITVELP